MKSKITLVTGLWDLGRGELKDFGRSIDHYKECFAKLLSLDVCMFIYVPQELENFVWEHRTSSNTRVVVKNLEDFDTWVDRFHKIQEIRNNSNWYTKASWLENSPQAKLKYYNPIVMSKFFMVNDASIFNPFQSDYFFWIDGGLTNTVGLDLISNVKKISSYMKDINDKMLFLSFPYENDNEVHGFESQAFYRYCEVEKTSYVCRGGFFGGSKKTINDMNGNYISIMNRSLEDGYMGTEENYHTILSYKFPNIVHRFEIEPNGLVYSFFDMLNKYDQEEKQSSSNDLLITYDKRKSLDEIKTSLYVLTFNSPKQFEVLIQSFYNTDQYFMKGTRKMLIDNSTDSSTYTAYNKLCVEHGFEHIKKEENIGICGGRQFVAEHFNESDSEYYIFFEDDMNLHVPGNHKCDAGLYRYVENLFYKSLAIIHKERYDFLKMSFSEFFGNNHTQWSWYNVPQVVREQYFPDKTTLPEAGLDSNPPQIIPSERKRYKDLYYLEGEYYYCNWPLLFSRTGNRKVFLETKWERPFEQTWMSHAFQLQKKNQIRSAVLELSPIWHERFDHYSSDQRKES
jgi:hypothetical protein